MDELKKRNEVMKGFVEEVYALVAKHNVYSHELLWCLRHMEKHLFSDEQEVYASQEISKPSYVG